MSLATVAEPNEHALYPSDACRGQDTPQEVERQTRYLRDALQWVLGCEEVVGEQTLLGWNGDETVAMRPDVLVYHRGSRGNLGTPEMIPVRNPHPLEAARYCMLAIEVGDSHADLKPEPMGGDAMGWFGLPAYLHFDVPAQRVTAQRFVDKTPLQIAPNSQGRYLLADLNVGFGIDGDGFLRVYGSRGGKMPTYSEVYSSAVTDTGRQ